MCAPAGVLERLPRLAQMGGRRAPRRERLGEPELEQQTRPSLGCRGSSSARVGKDTAVSAAPLARADAAASVSVSTTHDSPRRGAGSRWVATCSDGACDAASDAAARAWRITRSPIGVRGRSRRARAGARRWRVPASAGCRRDRVRTRRPPPPLLTPASSATRRCAAPSPTTARACATATASEPSAVKPLRAPCARSRGGRSPEPPPPQLRRAARPRPPSDVSSWRSSRGFPPVASRQAAANAGRAGCRGVRAIRAATPDSLNGRGRDRHGLGGSTRARRLKNQNPAPGSPERRLVARRKSGPGEPPCEVGR